MCFLKIKCLSIIIANNSTWSDSLILINSIVGQYKDYPRIINWNFAGLNLSEFKLNHLKRIFTSCSRLSKFLRDYLQKHCIKKCPYSELFWSVFSRIRTEYGGIRSISRYSVRMRENTDQNNSECEHILCSMLNELNIYKLYVFLNFSV